MNRKKIGLFGGSFDPIHYGHLTIAEKSLDVCDLDKVIFLPCSQSPLKDQLPHATDVQRLEMLRLATQDLPWAAVDGKDLEWPPPSWSWRLAEYYRGLHPDADLYWIMGSDQWKDLEKWSRWPHLAEIVTFIVHHRGETPLAHPHAKAVFVEGDHPASASRIRENRSVVSDWLPPSVAKYIDENGLYLK